eukprot:CAMPEP_0113312090 /NCGR_PEP_ID=MMETSP0010_2-20120614/9054_1 /TAXON_ID=216773 ORGANISM="Corethron hystrix, Strain 308" /NCGR_SAMPLE_ID=MMETSP0010_2 /ASSEMBLY_ACC=CAM_ASM_000155 /LENGTH=47 /DNA_ID=CAMNT_0000167835 /DNA_START=495 /DNA_END=634 /DNA_ORIENTATION=+ /assembly_acc=CAM_ASM_000155
MSEYDRTLFKIYERILDDLVETSPPSSSPALSSSFLTAPSHSDPPLP